MPSARNVFRLGVKELWSLARDPAMLVLIVYAFTLSIYVASTAVSETLNRVPIAIVDEDASPLSGRIVSAFYPPHFLPPSRIALDEMDRGLDAGRYTFVVDIPPGFQADVLAGRQPAIQLNVDATRMSQAFIGSGAIQQIIAAEVAEFVQGYRGSAPVPVTIEQRMRFNPTLEHAWMTSVMQISTGLTRALRRERKATQSDSSQAASVTVSHSNGVDDR